MDLTDEQWAIVDPLIPVPRRRPDGRGRPWRARREVVNGILWILRTGAAWHDLPKRYPPYQTCHRRFQQWVRSGVLVRVLRALAADLKTRGGLDLAECFIDDSLVAAKSRGPVSGRPAGPRALASWQWQTAMVFQSPVTWPALGATRSSIRRSSVVDNSTRPLTSPNQ